MGDSDSSSESGRSTRTSDERKLTCLLSLDREASTLFSGFRSPSRSQLSVSLGSLTKLDLPNCNLNDESLPSNLDECLPSLRTLFCFKNGFTVMPQVVGKCKHLNMVSFKSNKITSIHPESLQIQLTWLILTDNGITEIPSTIGRCVNMRKLMLSGNSLAELPSSISCLENLELVRLSQNKLASPPMALLTLPKLAWVALSGNPFLDGVADSLPSPATPSLISPSELTNPKPRSKPIVLGAGASGTTKLMSYQGRSVAVKEYSQDSRVTSDGSPADEMSCALRAGTMNLESVIKVIGICSPSPSSSSPSSAPPSLVMEYLSGYSPLGSPPSLSTCTRDVYDGKLTLTPAQADDVVTEMGKALATMHNNGVCHGDFYSHNIMIRSVPGGGDDDDDDGEGVALSVKLGDFGASFLYDPKSHLGSVIEKISLRSYRIFLGEVASLVAPPRPRDYLGVQILSQLEHLCASIDVSRHDVTSGFAACKVHPRLYKCTPDSFMMWPRWFRMLSGYVTACLFTASFFSIPLLSLLLLPLSWSTFNRRMCSTIVSASYAASALLPAREWPAFRKLGQLWYEIFDLHSSVSPRGLRRKIRDGQRRKFVMAMHPHGIIPLHAVLWAAYCDQYMTDPITGDSLYGFGAAADVVDRIPFVRNVMGWLSAGSASYGVLRDGLCRGKAAQVNRNNNRKPRHLFVLPGGIAEVFTSSPDRDVINIKERRGLMRLALESNATIIPCYAFGATSFFDQANIISSSAAERASRKYKVGLCMFYGALYCPILPVRARVTMCFGEPVEPAEANSNPDPDPDTNSTSDNAIVPSSNERSKYAKESIAVERMHADYLTSITNVYDRYKVGIEGGADRKLEIR